MRCCAARTPAPAVPGSTGEQVGLATPEFQDALLGPVAFRKIRAQIVWAKASGSKSDGDKATRYELLVSAAAVERLVGSLAYESASVLFRNALGVLVGETLLQVDSCTGVEVSGGVILYRLLLRAPLQLVA
jgi:hypothetical protein